jgi:hypothetical protein
MGKSYIIKYFAENIQDIKDKKTSIPVYTGMNFKEVFEHFILQNKGNIKDKSLVMFEQTKPASLNTPIITFLQDFKFFYSKEYPEGSNIIDTVEIWRENNIYNEDKRGYQPYLKQGKHYKKTYIKDYPELIGIYFLDNLRHYIMQ